MPRQHFLIPLILLTLAAGRVILSGADPQPAKEKSPSFVGEILPILQAKCWRCHGEKVRRADLDLRTPASILAGGETGPAVVPGKPDDSLLYENVHGGAMPPNKKDPLSKAEVELVRDWIEAGAKSGDDKADPARGAVTRHDIQPILLRHCTVCHGMHRKEGRLDLRTRDSILRGGKSGPAIDLGKPNASLLMKKIRAGEMPPRDRLVEVSVKPVEQAETDLLAQWIEAKAPEGTVGPDVASTTPET